jgi:hypothetical protein
MADLSISRAWDETKAVLARDGKLVSTVALALLFLPQVVANTVSPPANLAAEAAPRFAGLVVLAALLIGGVGQLAIVRLAVGPATSVGDSIRHGGRRFLPAIIAFILLLCGMALVLSPVLIALGLGPMIMDPASAPPDQFLGRLSLAALIALLISVKFMLVTPVASTEAVGPLRILKRSWQLTAGHYLRLLAFIILVAIPAAIVLVASQFIGIIVARLLADSINPLSAGALVFALITAATQAALSAVFTVMLARIYAQVAGHFAEPSVPSTGD